jgi:hypothetical protein
MFWAHVQMLDRLIAEQALARVSQTAAGSGHMKDQATGERYMRSLERQAAGEQQSQKASLEQVAGLGIDVHAEEVND